MLVPGIVLMHSRYQPPMLIASTLECMIGNGKTWLSYPSYLGATYSLRVTCTRSSLRIYPAALRSNKTFDASNALNLVVVCPLLVQEKAQTPPNYAILHRRFSSCHLNLGQRDDERAREAERVRHVIEITMLKFA